MNDVPHITIIRPIRGLEPFLYECLAATFQQSYPKEKLTIHFCMTSAHDPAISTVQRLVRDFRSFDCHLLIADERVAQEQAAGAKLGPNPKIRNMSRAYREAKGDLIWIVDCNVWVSKATAGRMVDKICGLSGSPKQKFVHQLPLVVDVTGLDPALLRSQRSGHELAASTSTAAVETLRPTDRKDLNVVSKALRVGGARLEEMFLSSSHAKFYTAINTALVAPCIVGKSNMFRRSHLNSLTMGAQDRPVGIDYFSHNICEDHLIGDLLWRKEVPEELGPNSDTFGKHALVFGVLAIQPMANMSIVEYIARRTRWLRVRKFTVPMATLVEPGTESFLCSIYIAYAITALSWFQEYLGIPISWKSRAAVWLLSVCIWALVDWTLYRLLHFMGSVETADETPKFARSPAHEDTRSFPVWLAAWIGREALALPIWLWAVFGGTTVKWRGQKFRVGLDMRVHAIEEPIPESQKVENGTTVLKTRKE
ncbi:MAG: hypothetical protein M1831_002445 [Alyxoria varia]|nr:MAG: hypothetical protein M1831_002445 [Alyxoria varia]